MSRVIFYEKPGCQGNAQQKALLTAAGHEVCAKSLLAEVWTAETLLAFLAPLPVSEWFNLSAPTVKSGEIRPSNLTAEEALPLLLAQPLLIRRPLLQVGEQRQVGFDPAVIAAWIGLPGVTLPLGRQEACAHRPGDNPCHHHAPMPELEESAHGRDC